MKPQNSRAIRFWTVSAVLCTAWGSLGAGVPEPGIVLYGKVWDNGSLLTAGQLTWTYVAQRRETVQVTVPLEALTAPNGDTFSYRVVIPAETPVTGLPLSANVLEVTEQGLAYTRGATVDGVAVAVAGNRDTDTFSVEERGKLERVDLAMSGSIVPTYDCSGVITYGGHQPGQVIVQAFTNPDLFGVPERSYGLGRETTVNYAFTGLPAGDYYLRAFRDVDGNGEPSPFEAQGMYAVNPARLPPDLANADILLVDPDTDRDGLPDWWEIRHFVGLGQFAGDDPDGDGRTNADEYAMLCDPLSNEDICALALFPGWNLVSLSVIPEDLDVDAVFPVNVISRPILEWLGSYVETSTVGPKTGYWLYLDWIASEREDSCRLDVPGQWAADRSYHLAAGWNIVGPVLECARPTHPGIADLIWCWDAERKAYVPLGENDTLKVGCAYWIYAANACDVDL